MIITTDSDDEEEKCKEKGLKEKLNKVKRILKPWVIGQKLKEVFNRIFKKQWANSVNNSEGENFSDLEDHQASLA